MRRHCRGDTVSYPRHQQIKECRATNISTDVKTNTALRRTTVRMIMPVDGRSTAIIHIREQPQLTLRSLSLKIKMHLAAANHPNNNSSTLWSNNWHSRRKRHPWKGVLQCHREASRRSCLATAVSVRPVFLCAWHRITSIPAVMPFPSPLSRWILAGRSSGFSLHKHQLLCSVSRLVTKISWWILCKRIRRISP